MDVPRMLADMAHALEAERTPEDVLRTVSFYARDVLGADAAGILVLEDRAYVETAAGTDPVVDALHRLQGEHDEGPCLDAIRGKATYVTDDAAVDPRWPSWGPAAAKLGVHSVIGCRLATRAVGYGSINVYADRASVFDDTAAGIVELLAAQATVALGAARREAELTSAMETRTVIGQAQGILMQKFDIDADTAFAFLQRISQHENTKLAAIAEAIAVQRDANARP